MHRRSRDRLISATDDAHTPRVECLCICIRRYARIDFKGVLFPYVTVNIEPYGIVQIMLLCNKSF